MLLIRAAPSSAAATGCGYPSTLDTFTNVITGQLLTASDYNKIQCAVENLEANLSLPLFTVATRPSTPNVGRLIYVTDAIDATTCNTGGGSTKNECVWNGSNWVVIGSGAGGGAPTGATYITMTSDGTLSAEFALGSLATGLLKNTTTTGVPTIAVEGTDYYKPGGVKVALGDGGTGSGTQAGAQAALGVVPGTDVLKQRTFTGHTNVLAIAFPDAISGAPGFTIDNSVIDGSSRFALDAGSSDDYVACPRSISTMSSPGYIDGSIHSFRANTANTGGATINLCSLGARTLVKVAGGVSTPLASSDIRVGQNVIIQYNSSNTNFQVQSTLGNAGGGSGTPGGSDTQCQFNDGGVFGGEAGCTYNKTTDILSAVGGFEAGNVATNSVKYVMGGGVAGHRIYTAARDTDGDVALTTGNLINGNTSAYDSAGRLKDGGPLEIVGGIDRDGGLVNTDDRKKIYANEGGTKTITQIKCWTDTGTSRVNFQRDDGSAANILSSDLDCSTTGASSTTFSGSENVISNGHKIDFSMVTAALSGAPTQVTWSILATK